ncbi:hypothetical protein KR222_006439, partial [Zaprionus bogoriensis]
ACAEDALPAVVPKTPTEKPPVAAPAPAPAPAPAAKVKAEPVQAQSSVEQPQTDEKSAQPHTVADFIIHPLIAFKPRQASAEELGQAKQASGTAGGSDTSSSSPGAWLFGMNPGQNLGSSFSTLAGSVSGWFNNRLAAAGQQIPVLNGLPGLVDTPVRDSTSTTSTTTTQRPDVVVRLQQRPNRRRGNGNGNANGNGNGNGNGNRHGNRNGNRKGNGNGNNIQRPNRFNNRVDSLESDEYDDDYFNDNRFDEEFDDDEHTSTDDQSAAEADDDEDVEQSAEQQVEQQPQQQQKRRRINQSQATPLRRKPQSQPQLQLQSTAQSTSHRRQLSQNTRRGQPLALLEQAEDEEEEEEDDDDAEEQESEDDDEAAEESEESYDPVIYKQSSRKTQSQPGFIQSGQQSLINQLRRFTFGQTPNELGNKLRRTSATSSGQNPNRNGARRPQQPQQATFLINRNGQTVYVAPELLDLAAAYPYGFVPAPSKKQQQQQLQLQQQLHRKPVSAYPQPPLTVPVRRKGRPTQYITIPWSQLGLSPPDRQSVVSLAEGIQSQPLILNIPESAISTVPVRGASVTTTTTTTNTQKQKKKKRPTLTAAAVPLLADASLMDIFQPPQIPPSRTGASSMTSTTKTKAKPVLIAAKPVTAGAAAGLLPTRIRPGTIVEKAPAVMEVAEKPQAPMTPLVEQQSQQQQQEAAEPMSAGQMTGATVAGASNAEMPLEAAQPAPEQEYIIVGDDNEPGLSRHVQPVYGDARYVSYGDFHPYFDLLHQNRRFALRKVGRALQPEAEEAKEEVKQAETEAKAKETEAKDSAP